MLGSRRPWGRWTLQRNAAFKEGRGPRALAGGRGLTGVETAVWQGARLPPQRGAAFLQLLLQDDLTQVRPNLQNPSKQIKEQRIRSKGATSGIT